MTDLDLHMPLVPKPCALIYPTHTEVQQYTNVLLIDASIQEYQQFIDSANADTFPIVYSIMSSKTDLLELLKTTFTSISRLGLVFHSSSSGDSITFLDSEPLFVPDEVNANQQFIKDIINEFQIKNIDYLACDTLNYPNWVNYYNAIAQDTGVIIGASNDKTGNVKYGGDWVLETTSENIELIYFTQSIEYYKYLLATPVTFTDSIGITYTSNVDGTSCYVSSNITTLSGNIVIPDKVTNNNITYNVTGIGNFAFLECASLTSITIGKLITSIGNNAFEACTGLKTVIFMDQNSLTSIGTELFKNDTNITNVLFYNTTSSANLSQNLNSMFNPTPVFNYISPAPTVSSSAYTSGERSVKLIGTNFLDASSVTFDASAAINFVVVSSTIITCTAPFRIVGDSSYNVVVTTPKGTSQSTRVTFNSVYPPIINIVNPDTSSRTRVAIQGTTETMLSTSVTIPGTNYFTGATYINIVADFARLTDTSINFSFPPGIPITSVLVGTILLDGAIQMHLLVSEPQLPLSIYRQINPALQIAQGWSALGSGVGNREVEAIAIDSNNNVYVGGKIGNAGGTTVYGIAKWNGSSWSGLGTTVAGEVLAIAIDSSNNVYVGGIINTDTGGIPVNRIAKWDGSTWSALGSGVNNIVNAIAIDSNDNVYVGGSFTNASGIPVNNIAKWDPSSSTWSALGSGVNSYIVAIAIDSSNNVYVGGAFSNASGIPVNNIAKWDGSTWSALGSGVNNIVNAIAIDSNNNVYVGGQFTTAGGMTVNRIAKWNGSWSALGSGVNNSVYAIAIDSNNNVYIGGILTAVNGISVNKIAKWDGSTWSALGSGIIGYVLALAIDTNNIVYVGGRISGAGGISVGNIAKWYPVWSELQISSYWLTLGSGVNNPVRDIVVDSSNNVYVGGQFTTAGTTQVNYIAKWNGSNWSSLGTGVNNILYATAIDSNNNVYVGGQFTTAGTTQANYIAKWDGSKWLPLGSGVNGNVFAVAIDSNNNVYVGGQFTTADGTTVNRIAKWDGSTWSALGIGVNSSVQAIAIDSTNNVYVGGYFATAGTTQVNYIAKWDGLNWSALGGGTDGYVIALSIDSNDNVYVGGIFYFAGTTQVNNVAKWDGSSWSAISTGINEQVYALAIDSSNKVYVGGKFTATTDRISLKYIASYTSLSRSAISIGSSWSALRSGVNGKSNAIAIDSNNNVYVGGGFTSASGILVNRIAKWDSSSSKWSSLGRGVNYNDGNPAYQVYTVAIDSNDNVYVGGSFTDASGIPVNNIAKWDGSTWSALGSGVNTYVNAIAIDSNDNIYVGGQFTTASGILVNRIAKWNGSIWSALGSGVNNTVNAIAIDSNNNVYVGGQFTTAGTTQVNYIAKWNGSTWSALGSGVNYDVYAIAIDSNNNVYVGGAFSNASGILVNRIEKWNGSSWSALGNGVDGNFVFSLAIDSTNNLYVGGQFTTAGGITVNRIAKWDGSNWSSLGSGVNYDVNAIAIDSTDNVYVGGEFITASGKTVNNIAKWTP